MSHSPFGVLYQIATATGWTIDYILWQVNYQTLRMMLADAPRPRGGGDKAHKSPQGKKTTLADVIARKTKKQ